MMAVAEKMNFTPEAFELAGRVRATQDAVHMAGVSFPWAADAGVKTEGTHVRARARLTGWQVGETLRVIELKILNETAPDFDPKGP